jgi:hypothetical protein
MGLSSVFVTIPPPSGLAHRANDGLPAGVDVHVLDGNFLLALPAIALQCLGLGREGSQQFHSEISVAVLLHADATHQGHAPLLQPSVTKSRFSRQWAIGAPAPSLILRRTSPSGTAAAEISISVQKTSTLGETPA